MSMIKRNDCACSNDWKNKLNQLWERYQSTIRKIKAGGTVVSPDGDGIADITDLIETVTVDTALDTASTNPVENRVIANAIGGIETDISNIEASIDGLSDVARTGDYDDLMNKPTIPAAQVNSDWDAASGVAQILNKPNLAEVATSGSYNDLSDKPIIPPGSVLYPTTGQNEDGAITQKGTTDALALKQDMLTFDAAPTANSSNPVTSNGIKTALDAKQNALTFDTTPIANSNNPVTSGGIKNALDAKQDALTFDTTPIANSNNPVTSGGIKNALDAKQDALTFDTAPTANSSNPVTSGGVYSALQNVGVNIGGRYCTTAGQIYTTLEDIIYTPLYEQLKMVVTVMMSLYYDGSDYLFQGFPKYVNGDIKLDFIDQNGSIKTITVKSSTLTMPSGYTLNNMNIWWIVQS